MKNPWIRLYREALHNPKVVTLNDRQHRAWHNCMLMSDDTGKLPKWRDMACHMRMTVQEAEQVVCELVEAGLIDIEGFGPDRVFKLHDWTEHQYISDSSTERVRKFRSKSKDEMDETATKRFCNGGVTPPEQNQITDTDTESKLQPSEQVAARGKSELGSNSISKKSGSDREWEVIKQQAEGFGLDVDELLEITNRNKPKKREGYFVKLCVNRLTGNLPGLDHQIIRDALNGKHEQAKLVTSLLMGVVP